SLAEAQHQVRSCIAGKETEKLVPSEIEELLVHFTHARRLPGKLKDAADATRAKDATEYIAALEKKNVPDVRSLYKELCEYVHPAKSSVSFSLAADAEGRRRIDPESDQRVIAELLHRYRKTFDECVMFAFNPALLTLRVLHRFGITPQIPELRRYKFSR